MTCNIISVAGSAVSFVTIPFAVLEIGGSAADGLLVVLAGSGWGLAIDGASFAVAGALQLRTGVVGGRRVIAQRVTARGQNSATNFSAAARPWPFCQRPTIAFKYRFEIDRPQCG